MTLRHSRQRFMQVLSVGLLCFPVCLMLCSCSAEKPAPPARTAPVAQTAAPSRPDVAATKEAPQVVAPVVSAREIPNFHTVTPFLYRGAEPTTPGLETLQKWGMKTVIDLLIAPKTVAAEREQVERMGMRFINLPMSGDPPTEAQIQTFLKTVTDSASQPVFVHCQHGADRTGTMVGIYREQVEHWSYERAAKEMKQYGFNPHWQKLSATVRRFAPDKP